MNINEYEIRTIVFVLVFLVISLLEISSPRRSKSDSSRKLNNFLILIIDILCVRLIFPMASVGIATYAEINNLGLINFYDLDSTLWVVVTVLSLDFFIYIQHLLSHKFNFLWRLHRVHHSDTEFDLTTALRFHPLEIILSIFFKSILILILGCSPVAILIFETILNSTAIFNHGNVFIPKSMDKVIRLFVVTPDMHRIHHSTLNEEMNSNFGFNISIWDRLFSTYTDKPKAGHNVMKIGLNRFREKKDSSLASMLIQPFK